jgi:flavin-dependent dehydrogenase
MREVVIVGGGPAGAVCGETLARAGIAVTLFDDHLAWEKPCGGGLTQRAVRAFPFLLDGPHPKRLVNEIELMADSGARAHLTLDGPILIYSRRVLNGLLLDRAAAAGCRIVRSRVTAMRADGPRPCVVADGVGHAADFVVLAAGARNRLLPAVEPLEPADLEQTLGYYVPVQSNVMKIKFLSRFRGYLWSFPRLDHLSVGICGKLDESPTATLRKHLEAFMDLERLPREGARLFSHLLPSPRQRTLRRRALVGRHWALAGDAAAMVDSVTGEGLYYAMRSGELLGQALVAGRPEQYPRRLRSEFGGELESAALLAPRFFSERFLGGAMSTRTVEFAHRSPTFRRMLAAVFSGRQGYRTLQLRLWAQLPLSLAEIAWSFLAGAGRDASAADSVPGT